MISHRLAVILVLAACGGKQSPPPPIENTNRAAEPAQSEMELALEKMTAFADSMCRCTDDACVDAVQAGMSKWSREWSGRARAHHAPKPTVAERQRQTEAAKKFAKCMMKVYELGL